VGKHVDDPGCRTPIARLVDQQAFIAVGGLHNLGYAGGVLGLCVAVSVMVWRRRRMA